jgi:hypothetical protein
MPKVSRGELPSFLVFGAISGCRGIGYGYGFGGGFGFGVGWGGGDGFGFGYCDEDYHCASGDGTGKYYHLDELPTYKALYEPQNK